MKVGSEASPRREFRIMSKAPTRILSLEMVFIVFFTERMAVLLLP